MFPPASARPAPRIALLALALFATGSARPQETVPAGFIDELVTSSPAPTVLAQAPAPDHRVLVGSQDGEIWWLDLATGQRQFPAAVDLESRTCANGERGLLGLAFDPDFGAGLGRDHVFAFYTFRKGGGCETFDVNAPVNRVSRFAVEGDTILLASETVLVDNIISFAGNHNAGDLAFGPDERLYIATGDGGCDHTRGHGCASANAAARDRHVLLGKILRIGRDGSIPPDNPFQGPDSARCHLTGRTDPGLDCRETFAWGLRNPFRIAVDPNAAATRIFVNDVGQSLREEINLLAPGADYGWNLREGRCVTGTSNCAGAPPAGITNPIHDYAHGECGSITGAAFVPEGAWPAAFDGDYLFGDFNCGRIFRLESSGGGSWTSSSFANQLGGGGPVTMRFLVATDGTHLYYTTYAQGGQVRRIRSVQAGNRAPEARIAATPTAGLLPLSVTLDGSASSDPDGDALEYRWNFGDGSPLAVTASPEMGHTYGQSGAFVASLVVEDEQGARSAPATVAIQAGNQPPQIQFLRPAAAFRFAASQTFVFRVAASDPEDGVLPASAVTIRANLLHESHAHPFLPSGTGLRRSVVAPQPEDLLAAATNRLEFVVTARDADGNETEARRVIQPKKVNLRFETDPPGLRLFANAVPFRAPRTFTSWLNYEITVEARAQRRNGVRWEFDSWSDGGAAVHDITTPAKALTLTARFRRAGTTAPAD